LQATLGRLGTADAVAYGILSLASDESSYVIRVEPVIDGAVAQYCSGYIGLAASE